MISTDSIVDYCFAANTFCVVQVIIITDALVMVELFAAVNILIQFRIFFC